MLRLVETETLLSLIGPKSCPEAMLAWNDLARYLQKSIIYQQYSYSESGLCYTTMSMCIEIFLLTMTQAHINKRDIQHFSTPTLQQHHAHGTASTVGQRRAKAPLLYDERMLKARPCLLQCWMRETAVHHQMSAGLG